MSAAQLLTELQTLGVKVWPDAGALRFKAPAGVMTPELAARVKAIKPELMAILTGEAANDEGEARTDDALLADTLELDAIITRLCDRARYPDALRHEMHEARKRMSPDNLRRELPIMRERLAQRGA